MAVTSPTSPIAMLVTRGAVEVPADETLTRTATRMADEGVTAVLLAGAIGIITDRDIARGVAAGVDPASPVVDWATPHPITVDGGTSIVEAAAIMLNQQVGHLVLRLDGATGIVALRDIVAVLLQFAHPQLWLTTLRMRVEAPPEIWLG